MAFPASVFSRLPAFFANFTGTAPFGAGGSVTSGDASSIAASIAMVDAMGTWDGDQALRLRLNGCPAMVRVWDTKILKTGTAKVAGKKT